MRWRDVKQGRQSAPLAAKKKTQSTIPPIAPIIDRIKAFITDTFMVTMPIMYFVFYVVMGSREAFSENMTLGWLYIAIPHFIIVLLLFYFKGQTPGYKYVQIKLVDSEGNPPALLQIAFRYFFFAASIPLIAGLFICFIRKDRKNMHDIFSGTMPVIIPKHES